VAGRRGRRAGRYPGALAPLAPAVLALAGCGGSQDVLRPESGPEHRIADLWWIMLGGATVGFAVVAGLLLLGWLRRSSGGLPGGGGDRAATRLVVALGVVVPILALSALFAWSNLFVLKSTAAPARGSTRLTVHVTGHQWWWEVRYPGRGVVGANEIHVPARTRVRLEVSAHDVIHSFWVPSLNRKIDMIPGRTSSILIDAERPGVYRGQCAEFCGLQHANMAMAVYADPPARFRAWLDRNARPARTPAGAQARRGLDVFLSAGCADCHAIRGTSADARVGPDLTHLAGRQTIAARTLPNDRAHLAAWIRNPQDAKPGAKMPAFGSLPDADLRALVTYLGSLR
jgi:cytochrome c oxidase subunit II